MSAHRETLVCLDFGPTRDGRVPRPQDLIDEILSHDDSATYTYDQVAHWRTGEPQARLSITFSTGNLRYTHAHGIGRAHGYVCYISHV